MKKKTYGLFTFIKIIDLIFIMTIYFIVAFIVSLVIQKFLPLILTTDKITKQQWFSVAFELILSISIIVIVGYFCRNLVLYIPFPLDGIEGFDHMRVKELDGSLLISLLFIFNSQIIAKAQELFTMF